MNNDFNLIKASASRFSIIKIIIFSIAALLLNIVFAFAAVKFHLIIFLDTIFTVAITFYMGLIPGLLVAFFYNPLMMTILCITNGTQFFIYETLYLFCGMFIVLITWLISKNKRNFLYSTAYTFLYLVIIAFVSAIASCLCASFLDTFIRPLFGQISGFSPTEDFTYSFQNLNLGDFLSFFLVRIPITVVDRLICTFAGYGVYLLLSKISPVAETTISKR